MSKIIAVISLFFGFLIPPSFGQSFPPSGKKSPPATSSYLVRVDWRQGSDITDSRFDWVRDLHRASGFRAVDIRVGIQTSYEREWARLLNYPAFGIGYASYWFDQKAVQDMVGAPNALYLFGMFPILRTRPFQLNLDMAGGLSFNFRPYHPERNPYNDVIGTPVLGYFDLGLSGVLQVFRSVDLVAGINMAHNSNGRIRTPNMGLDLVGMKFGLIVYPARSHKGLDYSSVSSVSAVPEPGGKAALLPRKASFWNVSVAGAINSTDLRNVGEPVFDIRGPQYFAMTLAAEWQRKYGGIGAYGLGVNVVYDGSLVEAYPDGESNPAKLTTVGLTLGHELFVHRLGFLTQVGLTPWNTSPKKEIRGLYYMRVGMRIRVTPNWWALVALKTVNGAAADFVEWGVGYSFLSSGKRKNS